MVSTYKVYKNYEAAHAGNYVEVFDKYFPFCLFIRSLSNRIFLKFLSNIIWNPLWKTLYEKHILKLFVAWYVRYYIILNDIILN